MIGRVTPRIARGARRLSSVPAKVESGGSSVTTRPAAPSRPAQSSYTPKSPEKAPSPFFGGRLFAFAAGFGLGSLVFAMPGFAGTRILHSEVTKNIQGIGADIEASNEELRKRVARLEHQLAHLESRK